MRRNEDDARLGGGLADPAHGGEIELRVRIAGNLIVDQPRAERPDGQSIRLRRIERVGADEVTGARHVTNDERGAGQIALHELGHEPSVGIVAAAGAGGHDVTDRLALVEIRAAVGKGCGRMKRCGSHEQTQCPRHRSLPPSLFKTAGARALFSAASEGSTSVLPECAGQQVCERLDDIVEDAALTPATLLRRAIHAGDRRSAGEWPESRPPVFVFRRRAWD